MNCLLLHESAHPRPLHLHGRHYCSTAALQQPRPTTAGEAEDRGRAAHTTAAAAGWEVKCGILDHVFQLFFEFFFFLKIFNTFGLRVGGWSDPSVEFSTLFFFFF